MPELLQHTLYYPSPREVEDLHSAIIGQRGTRGWMSKGMVKGCLEWASTYIFNVMPFPTFLSQGAALMYGFITFHPFTDGNKRTALMTTAFFFFINGHTLSIRSDAPEFTKSIAERCLDSEHNTEEEIKRISLWLKANTTSRRLTRLLYMIRRKNSRVGELLMLVAVEFWNSGAQQVFRRYLR